MSYSKAEQLIQAVVARLDLPRLSGVSQQGVGVYRSLNHALEQNSLPALVVNRGAAPRPQTANVAQLDRLVWVHVSVLAAGADSESEADAVMVEAHNRLFADRTLGGLALDLQEGDDAADTEEINTDICRLVKTYSIEYRTSTESLEA